VVFQRALMEFWRPFGLPRALFACLAYDMGDVPAWRFGMFIPSQPRPRRRACPEGKGDTARADGSKRIWNCWLSGKQPWMMMWVAHPAALSLEEFERLLNELSEGLPPLPTLPADFNRADLYDEHD